MPDLPPSDRVVESLKMISCRAPEVVNTRTNGLDFVCASL